MLLKVSYRQLLLPLPLLVVLFDVCDLVEAEAVENGAIGVLSVAEIHRPHMFVVQIFDWKVGE